MSQRVSNPLLPVLSALDGNESPRLLERELERASDDQHLSEAECDVVRRIDSSLRRGKRRESLLRVLLETTTDLVAITDFDAMLHAIVRRTRMILGSDMAYISLNNYDTRETFIHTTDGVATEAYRNIRMELGTGVLGKIAAGTGSAQAIDYIADPDIIHVPEIDDTVVAEGVRSIMGAPLLRDGVLLGALLVAERYQRRYTAEEIWLVESMSALACVALSNARFIGDMQAALEERDRLQATLETEKSRLASEQEFERALVECAVSADPYGQFLEQVVEYQSGELWLVDDLGKWIRGTRELPAPESALEKALARSHRSGDFAPVGTVGVGVGGGAGLSILAVGAAARLLGGIVVEGNVDQDRERVLRRAAVMLSVLRLIDESSREEAARAQSGFVHAFLVPPENFEESMLLRAGRFGLSEGHPVFVHVVDSDSRAALIVDVLCSLPAWSAGAVAEYGGRTVVMGSENVGEAIVQQLARKQVSATVGIGIEGRLGGSLARAHRTAEQTLHAMLALGIREESSTSAELGAVGMLMSSATPDQVRTLIDLEIEPLMNYDSERGSQLVETLWAFFASDRHQVRAAEYLHVHPNTLRQRLERISALLGEDWHTTRRSSMIYVALQLHRLQTKAPNSRYMSDPVL